MLLNHQLPASVFAVKPWEGVSSKYAFIPTSEVVEALGRRGVVPFGASERHTRIGSKRGYTKHLIRFRPLDMVPRIGGVHPEIVLSNAHDTGASFTIECGVFRLVCANGMVVKSASFSSYRVRHTGKSTLGDVLDATYRIIDQFPQVEAGIERMQNAQLSDEQRENMARLAMGLRWDAEKVPFAPARLLSTRRREDVGSSVWNTYQVIQENMLKGQPASRYDYTPSTKAVRGLDQGLKINRGLWELAEQFAGVTN